MQKITYNETEKKFEKNVPIAAAEEGKVTWYNFDTTEPEAVK